MLGRAGSMMSIDSAVSAKPGCQPDELDKRNLQGNRRKIRPRRDIVLRVSILVHGFAWK